MCRHCEGSRINANAKQSTRVPRSPPGQPIHATYLDLPLPYIEVSIIFLSILGFKLTLFHITYDSKTLKWEESPLTRENMPSLTSYV